MGQRISLMFCLLAALLLPNISATTQEDKPKVVASYSILADVVHNIAGDRIELTTLIPIGADPHSFQPSPRDLTPLSEADLIFVNGAGFEEGLLEVIESAAEDVPIVEASACIEIIPFGATGHMHEEDEQAHDDDDHADEDDHDADEHDDEDAHEDDDHADEDDDEHAHEDDDHADEDDDEHAHEDDDHADEHDDEDAHDDDHSDGMTGHCDEQASEFAMLIGEEEDHGHGAVLGRLEDIDCGGGHDHEADAHEAGACDPHVWMDPHNVIYWSLMIRGVLSELDPSHADDYSAAAADYISELVALEADFILPLLEELPVDQRILITSHDSLGYLATTFDFQIISTVIPGGQTLVEPSARDVAALIDLVRDAGVAAIFGETTVSTSVVETIAAETGAKLAIIYNDTLTADGPATTYLDAMRYNMRTIVDALGADG